MVGQAKLSLYYLFKIFFRNPFRGSLVKSYNIHDYQTMHQMSII